MNWNVISITNLIKEKVDLMRASEWAKLGDKVIDIEKKYMKNDHIIDQITEEFIAQVDNSDSEFSSEDEDDDEDYADDCDDDKLEDEGASTSTRFYGRHITS
ncbi:unnamed protein product [Parnassius apollo]|uniref:(apollo) hypothetical protein n=1 Tax=Parnassius apollo TaxID=110799 RepID=A0A8S3W022_PARAO|nr:unnamed protein product [Parnassius apollo]